MEYQNSTHLPDPTVVVVSISLECMVICAIRGCNIRNSTQEPRIVRKYADLADHVHYSVHHDGPLLIRYPRLVHLALTSPKEETQEKHRPKHLGDQN